MAIAANINALWKKIIKESTVTANQPAMVVCNPDGSNVGTNNVSTTTHTTTSSVVGDSASSVTLLAANTARTGFKIRNGSTAILYIEEGSTATSSSPIRLAENGYYESQPLAGGEVYRGIVTGIWASDAGGSAFIAESV